MTHRSMIFAPNRRAGRVVVRQWAERRARPHFRPYVLLSSGPWFVSHDNHWRNEIHRTTPLSKRATWRFSFRRGMSGRVRARLRRKQVAP